MTTRLAQRLLIAALFAIGLPAMAAIQLDQQVPVNPIVKKGQLANGLTYYIQRNAKPEKKLELRLVVKAGSILEDADQQGLAHFVEHMAFNGSTHFKKHELVSYLQSIGVKFGADLNAYTGFDETVYILPIPTDRKANLDKGFLVLSDWAQGVRFKHADIDKERDIVLEEARLGKGANDRINKQLLPKLFNGSRYAERLPIGKEEVLRNFKYDALKRYYRDWYRPDLMAVVVVGDVDPKLAERLIVRHFARLKNPAKPRKRFHTRIAQRSASEGVVITDKESPGNALLIRYPVRESRDDGTYGEYRTSLVERLFAAMFGQRLAEIAQQADPPFVGGNGAMSKLTMGYKAFTSFAVLGRRGPLPAIETLVSENERVRKFGFSTSELERSKKNLMRNFEQAYAEREKTDSAEYAAEYIRNFLENEPSPGIANEIAYAREMVPGITLAEINEYARATIPGKAAKLVVFTGSDNPGFALPSGPELLAAANAAESGNVVAYTEKAVSSRLMDAPPAAGRIVAEEQDKELGLTRLTLSNGVKVLLKPTDFRNDQVLMSAVRYGGQSLFGDQDIMHARLASAVVGTMGVNGYSPLELQKILAGQSASVRFNIGAYSENINGTSGSAASDIETMLQLAYLQFTSVRRDEDLYKSFIGKQRDLSQNILSQPEQQFSEAIVEKLYNRHPRAPRTPRPEDFDRLDLDRSIAIYKERFASAKGFTFMFVGAFDPAVVKPLIATYLGGLPAADIPVQYRDVGLRPASGKLQQEVRAGTEPKATVNMRFSGPAKFSEEAQLELDALLEVMNIRITDVLREKLTLIYGGGMSGGLNRVPYENFSIGASLPCGPANVDKVIAAVHEEIRRLKERGPDAADLEKVKQNWLQGYKRSIRENGYWLNRLQSAQLNDTDPAEILRYEARVKAITPARVQEAARTYFSVENYLQSVLLPTTPSAPRSGR
jgi:zinc protease